MPDKTGIQGLMVDVAYQIAERMPVEEWAGWIIYLLEILDGKDRQHIHRVWLEDIRDSISDRLIHGRW